MEKDSLDHSLEAFAQWLARVRRPSRSLAFPDATVLAAAKNTRNDFLASEREVEEQRGTAYVAYEEIHLLAASDTGEAAELPRMRTPRGFAISPIYRFGAQHGESPAYLLIECPADLVDLVVGETAYFFVAGEKFELGKFDSDGKATGVLPAGMVMKPPFGFSVGQFTEAPTQETDDD